MEFIGVIICVLFVLNGATSQGNNMSGIYYYSV